MKRIFRFNHGVIGGDEYDTILEILPQIKDYFTQRKQFHEYYFKPIEIELSLEEIDKISSEFIIVLNYEELIIRL